jgi:hypothetical protein
MTTAQFLMALTIGTALLALWSHVRWPGAAPATIKGAVLRILVAVGLLQVGLAALDLGAGTSPLLTILVVLGALVPVLTYAFLASLWFMKVCVDQMRGAL